MWSARCPRTPVRSLLPAIPRPPPEGRRRVQLKQLDPRATRVDPDDTALAREPERGPARDQAAPVDAGEPERAPPLDRGVGREIRRDPRQPAALSYSPRGRHPHALPIPPAGPSRDRPGARGD